MFLQGFWQALEDSPVGQYIQASTWAFPTIECLHVVSIVTVIGTIVVMDLRLLGVASKESPVTAIERDTLRLTWGAFVVAMITGALLFVSKAVDYMVNPFFLSKMVLIFLAGVNMAVFHVFTWPSVGTWDSDRAAPRSAKIAAGLSLGLWVTVVFVARAIGFTLDKYSNS